MANTRKTGYNSNQLPNFTDAQLAIRGAMNEAMALMNWPKVRVLASFSPLTMQVISGFRETCIRVLPMPSRQKEISSTG